MKKNTSILIEPLKIRDYDVEIVCGNFQQVLPNEYILPEKWLPPIHNQGYTSKCAMYSACQCAEFELLKRIGKLIHFSPSFGYGRHECRGNYNGAGLYISQAIKGLISIGFLEAKFFKFDEIDIPDIISLANERDDLLLLSKQFKPSGFVSLNYASEEKKWLAIKDALANKNNALMIISYDYFNESHAVMGIGYSNVKQGKKGKYIKIQNSWGKEWNKDGRDLIPLADIDGIYMFIWDAIVVPFQDVKETDWFYDDVKSMYLSGIIKGIDNMIFAPYDNLIRGDVAIIIHRLLERVEYSINCFIKTCKQEGCIVNSFVFNNNYQNIIQFNDVNETDYYAESIYYAVANNILKGMDNNNFEPTKPITRAELSTVIVRVYELIMEKLSSSFNKTIKITTKEPIVFQDVCKNKWYYTHIQSAYNYGFIQGDSIGMFRPDDFITRAETSVVIQRLFKAVENIMEQL